MTQQRTAALLTCILLTAGGVTLVPAQDLEASAVDTPATATRNASYVSNREPLQPSPFMKLPIGSVTPKGWLRHMLELEADGMTGRLEALSPWLNFNTSAWASPTGEGERGWEELPYWLKGYGDLGYVLHDETLIAEARKWIEPVLASQREDGWFGPRALLTSLDGKPDLWPHMVMLNILQSFYEFTEDPRVLPLMTRYFQWQNQLPATAFGEGYWPKIRAGDNIESVHWLYNRTGEAWLLELAQKIHDNMAPWQTDVINWHNVNIAQGFRAGTVFWPQSDDPDDLASAERNYRKVRDMYGQFGGGTWVGDENSRPGYTDPRGALETCAMVEFMHSAQMLTKITGDPVWADRCEEMALNSFPASQPADEKGLHYLTAPNMVLLDRENKSPGLQNGGCMLAYDPHGYRCCQHNVSHGWPYYAEELWLATPDNGLCASLYAASEVEAKVGEGAAVKISEQTDYPFRDTLRFTLSTPQEVRFPLYLRIPRWCEGAKVSVNGEPVGVTPKSSQYVRLERSWKADDRVDLQLPMALKATVWEKNHNCVSLDYGPLTYSLKIGERWERYGGTDEWPALEVFPTTPWNYGLELDPANPAASIEAVEKPGAVPDQPFTVDAAPVELHAKARNIPEWKIDGGLVGKLQPSPAKSAEPVETVTLIPLGCARLRISAFPTVSDSPDAPQWAEPPKPPLASHCNPGDTTNALNDELLPEHSGDQNIPRMTWWDHRGTPEWVAYAFEQPRKLSYSEVYWFDDTGVGQCRVPASWRLLWKDGDEWRPVEGQPAYGVAPNQFNRATFSPVTTQEVRLEVQLQPDVSGGILEWRVGE